jgi:GNAT superfamily N-acetyltransferase
MPSSPSGSQPDPRPPSGSGRPPSGQARWEELVGTRIVVRVRSVNGLYDVLGDLLEATDDRLRVLTRRGEVEVDRSTLVTGHPVPPPPSRAAPPHRALSVADLEAVMAKHWQAAETDWLGGWLLRATGGFTNRANSVLAVGEPGMPLAHAVLEVTDWYGDRGLPPVAAVPQAGADDPGTHQLVAAAGAFEAAGWQLIHDGSALVMTAPTGELRAPGPALPDGLRLEFADRPDDGWLAAYHYRGGSSVPPAGRHLLMSAPAQVFASIRHGDDVVGIARGSLADRWAGLTAMEIAPSHRRQGLARHLVAAIAGWGWDQGARSVYLQVTDTNTPAIGLYRVLGFETHHVYHYLTPPAAG